MPVDPAPRRRGRPPRVSRDQILAAALRIVDANGLDQLTMRRLGAELGIDPMTIYGHVPDKTALFDGLAELVLAEVTLPARTGEWAHDFRAAAHAARAALLAHPHLIPLLGTRPPVTQPAFTLWESITSILLDADLSEEQAADGADCLGRLLVGHALAEAGQPPGGDVAWRRGGAPPGAGCPSRDALPRVVTRPAGQRRPPPRPDLRTGPRRPDPRTPGSPPR